MKKRLDMLMMERALAPSREKAKAFIMAGDVYVDGQKEDKAGTMFPETVKIEVRGNTLPYVSRGGLKLEKAMKNFDVTLDSKVWAASSRRITLCARRPPPALTVSPMWLCRCRPGLPRQSGEMSLIGRSMRRSLPLAYPAAL